MCACSAFCRFPCPISPALPSRKLAFPAQTPPTAPAARRSASRTTTAAPSAPAASTSSARSAWRAGTRVRGGRGLPCGRCVPPGVSSTDTHGRGTNRPCCPLPPTSHPAPAGTQCVSAETKLAMLRRKMEGGGRAAVEDLRRQEQDLLSAAQIEVGRERERRVASRCPCNRCLALMPRRPTQPDHRTTPAENGQALPQVRHGDAEGRGLQQDGVRRLRRLLVLALRQGDRRVRRASAGCLCVRGRGEACCWADRRSAFMPI